MKALCCLLLILISFASLAQDKTGAPVPKRKYVTQRIEAGKAIKLDGEPNEAAWEAVPWSEGFIEYQPSENTEPYQQTHFKILYDNKYLYLAYQALDSAP